MRTLLSITLIITILVGNNTIYCGNLDQNNATTDLQELVRDFFDEMNQGEVDEFGRDINFRIQLDPRQGWPADTNVEDSIQIRREALYLFIAGTITLWLISRYGTSILETLFNMGRDLVQEGIPQALQALYPRQQVRDYALQLLDTPEGRERVLQAMNNIRNIRRGIGG